MQLWGLFRECSPSVLWGDEPLVVHHLRGFWGWIFIRTLRLHRSCLPYHFPVLNLLLNVKLWFHSRSTIAITAELVGEPRWCCDSQAPQHTSESSWDVRDGRGSSEDPNLHCTAELSWWYGRASRSATDSRAAVRPESSAGKKGISTGLLEVTVTYHGAYHGLCCWSARHVSGQLLQPDCGLQGFVSYSSGKVSAKCKWQIISDDIRSLLKYTLNNGCALIWWNQRFKPGSILKEQRLSLFVFF